MHEKADLYCVYRRLAARDELHSRLAEAAKYHDYSDTLKYPDFCSEGATTWR